jgi:hypothetical protein
MDLTNWRNEDWTGIIIVRVNQNREVKTTDKNRTRKKRKRNLTLSTYQRSTFTRR